MADNEEKEDVQSERLKHQLLIGLKTTVEGLLATSSSNVWGMYGGLPRLCKHVDRILNHRLKVVVGDYGSVIDYWPFVKGLKWLNPVMTPFIEKIRKGPHQKGVSKGQVWVRESLREHKLSMQLKVLVGSEQHMYRHYFDDAFLFSARYFKALCICLQAVEENRVSLLADIDAKLLNFNPSRVVPSHIRSASLPMSNLIPQQTNRRKASKSVCSDIAALAPPFVSPTPSRDSILTCSSEEHGVPYSIGSSTSPEESRPSARETMKNILKKSGSESDAVELSLADTKDNGFNLYDSLTSDPLLNLDLLNFPEPFSTSQESLAEKTKPTTTPKVKSTLTRSVSESGVNRKIKDSKAAEMMDKIIHETEDDSTFLTDISKSKQSNKSSISVTKRVEMVDPPPRSIFSDSETVDGMGSTANSLRQKRAKHVHKRSRSDISGIKMTPAVLESEAATGKEKEALQTADTVDNNSGGGGYFPQPRQGQSLLQYLSSHDFHTCANLEKENAHFSISEALIAAIEQMKWNHVISPHDTQTDEQEDSDEEIKQLQQRIRIRKHQKLKEKARGFPAFSDGKTDTGTGTSRSQSESPFSSPHDSEYTDSDTSSGVEDKQIELTMDETQGNLTTLKTSGLSLSMASLFSNADLQKTARASQFHESLGQESGASAESVAISLLKKFSEHQLPKASDLQWLVTEQDAPQQLLPLPNSYPVSPDDADNPRSSIKPSTRLRGNMEWAPPRPQIIFNIHPAPRRNSLLAKQNYRCTGCGMKVEPGYAKRYRYCEYLGKYFCQCCHSNQLATIPARILKKWDFTKYYVSNFAYNFLSKIPEEPLFNVADVNPMLYKKVKALSHVKDWREQLSHLKSLLALCKQATSLVEQMSKCPSHWILDIHSYSIHDLLSVKVGITSSLYTQLKNLTTDCISHVEHCQYCQCFGFICEVCRNQNEVIFPYELHRVMICQGCKSCFHKTCFVPNKCPKCARIEARKRNMETEDADDDS